jgi:hypothetical protein
MKGKLEMRKVEYKKRWGEWETWRAGAIRFLFCNPQY